jgi:cell division protein FtsW
MPRRLVADRWLFFTAGLLALAGVFLVGSASHYEATRLGGSPFALLLRHGVWLAVGVAVLAVAFRLPYPRLADRRLVLLLLCGSMAALVVVLFMPAAGGAHRWVRMGPFNVQPSEFVKLVVILYVAALLAAREERIHEARAVPGPVLAVVGTLAVLVAVEPDLGSAVMIAAVAFVMLFVAGLSWRHIGAASVLGAVLLVVAVLAEPYRLQRIRTFLQPGADPQNADYQLIQSLIAVGSGGLTGAGFGQGRQKAFFLPAAHTDFIFSVLGEEMGLIGAVLLLAAFLVLFWRGVRTALRAPDRHGFYLAMGVTSLLVIQALVHMGVCLGMLPTKGLPLPFISYGGSSLVATMAATGLLLNVSQHSG